MTNTKKLIISAICMALCVILPMAMHFSESAGIMFSPMHIPVLLCGLICGPQFGFLCGLIGPLLSSFIIGMPVMARLPGMMCELAIYGLIAGLLMKFIHTRKIYIDIYISLITAMLIGRIIGGIVNAFIFMAGSYSWTMWVTGYFVTCIPGIILQLALIPIIVVALMKADLIPMRYE